MRTCISHRTALSYLLRMPNLRRGDNRPSRASVIPKEIPENPAARALFDALKPNLSAGVDRLDVLVSTEGGRRQTKTVRAHLCTTSLPAGSFVSADAMGLEFHVCSPELVFLQMAEELEFTQLIYVGFALCSSFRLDEWEVGGCVHREGFDAPLTSVEKIRSYLGRLPEHTRNCAVALRALKYVRNGARSPKESGLAMIIGLPLSLGGWALGEVSLNQDIRVYDGIDARGEGRWVTRTPDILVTALDRNGNQRRVGVDYDAKSTHSAPERVLQDVDRRNLMAPTSSFTHITFGTWHTVNYMALRRELDRVRRALGQRQKPRLTGSPDSERNQRLVAEVRARQFDLWNQVFGGACLEL